jgi:quinone-modifying oxidoreductase subunit QmoA
VEKVEGGPGNYTVAVTLKPRYVNENCTCCGACAEACQTEIASDYDFGMKQIKAAYLPFAMAFPARFVIAPEIVGTEDGKRAKQACPYDAVELDMQPKTLTLNVGAVVWATGWAPYDATKMDNLGFGRHPNIITNMMMERLAAPNGPTQGKITRPSDGQAPESVAFVQCAGSRDENYLPYCSYICCMASLKQVTYLRSQYPETKIYIFYIDLRAPGHRYERFYETIKKDPNVFFIKGKVADVSEDPATGNITVVAENAVTGEKIHQAVAMVVLATGMQPSAALKKLPAAVKTSPEGFILNDYAAGGMLGAGCAHKPADVVSSNQNATGMALKAIQTLVRR